MVDQVNDLKGIAEQSVSGGQEAVSSTTEPDDEVDNAREDRQFQDIDALISFVEQTKLDQADVCSLEQALGAAGSMWEGRNHAVCKDLTALLATLRFYVQPEINQPGAIAIVGVAQGGQPGNPVDVTTMIAHASYCRVFRIWRVDDGSFIVKAAHEHLSSIDLAKPAIQGTGSGSYRLEWQEKRMEDGLIVAIPKGWEKTPSLNFVIAPSNSRRSLRLSEKGIKGPKGIDVPFDQIQEVQLTDKVFSFRRGRGGKKYAWPRSVFSPEDHAELAAWVEAWDARRS